jgi:hypothetical protein
VTNIVPLNKEAHRTLRVQPADNDAKAFVAVVVSEFTQLVVHYPILFSKNAETGTFYCGAMHGFEIGENLFRDAGPGIYRPLNLQRGPFYVVGEEVAIDLDSPCIGSGQALFNETGEPTPYLQSIMGLFRNLVSGAEQTKLFITALLANKLIEPVDIAVSFDDGTKRKLEGLFTVNQEKLRQLPDAVVVDFFRRGYLDLITMMLASLNQIAVLAKKKNLAPVEALAIGPKD